MTRGGYREGAGKPKGYKKPTSEAKTHRITINLTESQVKKFKELGGARWIKELLESGIK